LAADLVGLGVDVIIATGGLQASQAAISATRTIPIVFSTDGDPVQQGLVTSLNRPGGNATGITVFSASLTAKRLEVFRELVPEAKVFALLVNPSAAQAEEQVNETEEAGRSFGLEIRVTDARSETDFEPGLRSLAGVRDAALLVSADPLFLANRRSLVAAANRFAIPTMYGRRDFVTAGGLASYGADLADPYRIMGLYTARLLKGEKPADLPVVQPTKFELVVNLKTAKALGINLPQSILARVDEVIE
jgi:ABC-type uncharacterized transport system substrate-binding protein